MANIWSIPAQGPPSSLETFLAQYFGHLGSGYPFNAGASDITVSANTIWNDIVGHKTVKKLTINAGITLNINKSPFVILADEISFGSTSSCIDISGPSGADSGIHPSWCAKGGSLGDGPGRAQAGCGGGFLIVVCNSITGAAGMIKANGGNGYRNATSNAVTTSGEGGQGSLSSTVYYISTGSQVSQDFSINGLSSVLGAGGYAASFIGGVSGGSGGVNSTGGNATGGSGIGGGGPAQPNRSGSASLNKASLNTLFQLYKLGCFGGGGGGAYISNSDMVGLAGGGGGGGGAVLVFVKTALVTPTLQANGGTGASSANNNAGGSGITYLIQIPA